VDFSLTMRALARRWYVAVPVFVLVLAVSWFVTDKTPHQYESTGTVMLSEPSPSAALADHSLGANEIANPLLSVPDSLTTDAALLIQSLNSPAVERQVKAQGGTATFTASDGKLIGPFIVVVADAPTPGAVRQTVALAIQVGRQELAQRQHALGAPAKSYIQIKDVIQPSSPEHKLGGKSRLLIAVGALAVSASLGAAYAAETYARRRQRLRPAR
jgi:hypothetical protein